MRLFRRKQTPEASTVTGVHIESIHNDVPEFRRVYTAKLDNMASIKIDMRTSFGDRFSTGELTQPNGRWVLFDPGAIADKILDPALLPIIQRYVGEISALDKAFISSNPGEFTDEHGVKWKRVD